MVQTKIEEKLNNKTVLIVSHFYSQGPGTRLEEFLIPKVNKLIYISHPFFFSKDNRSFLRIYQKGKLIKNKKNIRLKGPEFIFWFRDIILTFLWIASVKGKIDYCFSLDSLLTNTVYPFKFFRKINKLVFYTIDFVPYRFSSRILNNFYSYLEKRAVTVSDKVWNLSSIMSEEREKRGYKKEYLKKQITVPIGTDLSVKPLPFNKIDQKKIVYLGIINRKQGVEILIEAMVDVVRELPEAHLLLIGGGPYIKLLQDKIKKLKLERSIKMTGFIEDFSEVVDLMRDGAIATAPYIDNDSAYTRYTDPGKPKDYLSIGLPVVITKVPQIAYEINKKQCGIAIDYNKNALSMAIIKLLSNKKLLLKYRNNAIKLAKSYSWEKIFKNAFEQTLSKLA